MRWVVGLVLISAAFLKAVQLVTDPTVALLAMRYPVVRDPVMRGSPDPAPVVRGLDLR
jgi:hypothetical protein